MDDLEIRYIFRGDGILHFNGDGKFLGTQSISGNELGVFVDASIIDPYFLRWYRIDGHFCINQNFYIDIEWSDLDESTCNMYESMLESMSIVELCDYVNTLDGL